MPPIYERAERHTRHPSELRPTCKDLRPKEDQTASCVTRKWNWQVPRPFVTVKSGRGACRFQWRVGPCYCEYPGVTYDLLVSNIGGTCDLADQLPSNREFSHFSVVSQSQVPREFGVSLALANEGRRYCVTPFVTGRAHTENYPCNMRNESLDFIMNDSVNTAKQNRVPPNL